MKQKLVEVESKFFIITYYIEGRYLIEEVYDKNLDTIIKTETIDMELKAIFNKYLE